MSQKNLLTKSALAAAVAIISSNVSAAGFQLNEFSSAGLGRSYSGEGAMADTAASASRNPALLMMYTRPELSIGAVFIDPDVDITGKSLPAPVWMRKTSRLPPGCRTCIMFTRLTISSP